MYNEKGFSLLSFLLYLAFFSMITLFFCHLVVVLIIPTFSSMKKCQSVITLHIASDFFVRDIRSVRQNVDTWKVISPPELIYNHENHDIGWSFLGDHLERREGTYNGNWKGIKASIIARGLSNVVFIPRKDQDRIIGMELILTPKCDIRKPITCYVALRRQEKP
jgi:type II secretory pathway component PulJ